MQQLESKTNFPIDYCIVSYRILFVHFKIDRFVIALKEMASFVFVL